MTTSTQIQRWDYEGGAQPEPRDTVPAALTGTTSQVEWAARIRCLVDAEFDRVAACFREIASKQSTGGQADTTAVLAILENKRAEVMSREQAGYYIHDWQDISDQVRQMIFHDPRYPAIRAQMAARRQNP